MRSPVLVILAAGMGSRFGGLKQITPIDDQGQMIIDYSLYDAWKAGFRKVVFIIKHEIEDAFKAAIGHRMERYFDVRYVFQELDRLPVGFSVPDGRTKPWGTAHAIACAKDAIDGPFAVLNADDYYGSRAMQTIFDFLAQDRPAGDHAMVGYLVRNTVTESGYVSRGVCDIDDNGCLKTVVERLHIEKRGDDAAYTEDGKTYIPLPGDTVVSMNLWGFQQEILDEFTGRFGPFLAENLPKNPLKCEYFLPFVANTQIQEGLGTVQVLPTEDVWYGMTYAEDLVSLKAAMVRMKAEGLYPDRLWLEPAAAYHFRLDGAPFSCEPYGSGHINATYLLTVTGGRRYIMQRINQRVFPDVKGLMENIRAVIAHLHAAGGESRAAMTLVPAIDGESFFTDDTGAYRVYEFVEGSLCLQQPESPEDFYESALAFGRFQQALATFPAETLHETIPNFHNTPDRYRIFHEVLQRDSEGRAAACRDEIDFALAREKDAGLLQTMSEGGALPLRVTHNDTKLNNVLLDAETRKALCVIDLDTVMPGLSLYDFGDSIRFGAATAPEDEEDLSRVEMSLELFRIYTKGFLTACPSLTETEISLLPEGARLMTLECGLRFLTDYLDGDRYFAVHKPAHNLIRARTQFRLVADMEKKSAEMHTIVKEILEDRQ